MGNTYETADVDPVWMGFAAGGALDFERVEVGFIFCVEGE